MFGRPEQPGVAEEDQFAESGRKLGITLPLRKDGK